MLTLRASLLPHSSQERCVRKNAMSNYFGIIFEDEIEKAKLIRLSHPPSIYILIDDSEHITDVVFVPIEVTTPLHPYLQRIAVGAKWQRSRLHRSKIGRLSSFSSYPSIDIVCNRPDQFAKWCHISKPLLAHRCVEHDHVVFHQTLENLKHLLQRFVIRSLSSMNN